MQKYRIHVAIFFALLPTAKPIKISTTKTNIALLPGGMSCAIIQPHTFNILAQIWECHPKFSVVPSSHPPHSYTHILFSSIFNAAEKKNPLPNECVGEYIESMQTLLNIFESMAMCVECNRSHHVADRRPTLSCSYFKRPNVWRRGMGVVGGCVDEMHFGHSRIVQMQLQLQFWHRSPTPVPEERRTTTKKIVHKCTRSPSSIEQFVSHNKIGNIEMCCLKFLRAGISLLDFTHPTEGWTTCHGWSVRVVRT